MAIPGCFYGFLFPVCTMVFSSMFLCHYNISTAHLQMFGLQGSSQRSVLLYNHFYVVAIKANHTLSPVVILTIQALFVFFTSHPHWSWIPIHTVHAVAQLYYTLWLCSHKAHDFSRHQQTLMEVQVSFQCLYQKYKR